MPFPIAAVLAGIGPLAKLFGGKLSGDAKRRQEQEAARLKYEADKKTWEQRDKSRISGLTGLQASVGARGIKGGLESFDPGMFQARPYTGQEVGKETGSSFLGDAISTGGDLASAASDAMSQDEGAQKKQEEWRQIMCAIYPQSCNPGEYNPGPSREEQDYANPGPCDIDPNLPGC